MNVGAERNPPEAQDWGSWRNANDVNSLKSPQKCSLMLKQAASLWMQLSTCFEGKSEHGRANSSNVCHQEAAQVTVSWW